MKTIISSSALTDTKFIFIKGIIKVNHREGDAHNLVLVSLLLTDGIRYFRKSVLEHWAILHTYIHIYLFIIYYYHYYPCYHYSTVEGQEIGVRIVAFLCGALKFES